MRTRLPNLWHYRWYRLLCWVSVLYIMTFVFVLPLVCHKWAYSKYFRKPKSPKDFIDRATERNNIAKKEAEDYFNSQDAQGTKDMYEKLMKNPSNDMAIAVITMKRASSQRPGYLTQTLAKLDKSIKTISNGHPYSQFNVNLFICDVNLSKELQQEARKMERYFVGRHFDRHKAAPNIYEKEKQDYIFCMKEALNTNSTFVLMLEDDALPRDDIFEVLPHLLKNHKKLSQGQQLLGQVQDLGHHHDVTNDWAFLKLYYPARWRGFGWEWRHLTDLFSIAALGGMFGLLTCKILQRNGRKSFTKTEELLIFILGALYFALLAVTIGKPYIMELLSCSKHFYRVSHAPGCCTPAVVYPKDKVKEMVEYLNAQTCNDSYGIDIALDNFAKSKNYVKLLVEPNLVNHIGMVSSLKGSKRYPQEFIFR